MAPPWCRKLRLHVVTEAQWAVPARWIVGAAAMAGRSNTFDNDEPGGEFGQGADWIGQCASSTPPTSTSTARCAGSTATRARRWTAAHATRSALERLVDTAIAERVDFVLLAGDIYDRDWQDFHTGLFFREQMVRLDRAEHPRVHRAG